MTLPPLPPPALVLPPLTPLTPPTGIVVLSRPGRQSARPVGSGQTSQGDDWVQVQLDQPDDAFARVELVSAGVPLHPASLVPTRGALHIITATTGPCVYRWRC